MADKRMFTKKVTDDDNFMSLSSSAQALYLHLSMSADDDGFSNQVAISMFKAHASVQDLEALLEKRYVYQFENGVIVIKHWRMANALRKDRYTPTAFQEELAKLSIKDNGSYTMATNGCQMVAVRLPQNSIDKDSIDYKDIVLYLNEKSGKNFRYSSRKTQDLINARLNEGFTVDDFKTVIDKKCAEWKGDQKMDQYLRPETLFGTKFEAYLNQNETKKKGLNNFDQREQDWDELDKLFNQ